MTQEQQIDYERDHSHVHCFASAKPPCGQCIAHLKCCLCEKYNPIVIQEIAEGEERGAAAMKQRCLEAFENCAVGGTVQYWKGYDKAVIDIRKRITALPVGEDKQ